MSMEILSKPEPSVKNELYYQIHFKLSIVWLWPKNKKIEKMLSTCGNILNVGNDSNTKGHQHNE